MNNCGGSMRPLTSGARTKARYFPSGDQRGVESRGPLVNWRVSPLAVVTVQIAVLYPSFLSLTVTRTNATREPSGETCGSPIQTKLNRSFSVILRFCARAGAPRKTTMIRRSETRKRMLWISFPSRRLRRFTQIDVVDDATIIVRQQKRILSEAENIRGAAINNRELE